MSLLNFKLIIEYDGTDFHGWQRQKNDRTIQQEIEQALFSMTATAQRITLNGSGRTDAGVHAYGQVANFLCETGLTGTVFQKGLNSILPDDIVIKDCRLVDPDFHARYDARSKIYHYRIINRSLPPAIGRQYAWFIRRELNPAAMRSALSQIIGSHDFKSFEGSGSPRAHTVRNIMTAGLTEHPDGLLVFEIEADGFLRFMVRNIVGTLVCVGQGKMNAAEFGEILASRNRDLAGPTAPPQGLFLVEVRYPSPTE